MGNLNPLLSVTAIFHGKPAVGAEPVPALAPSQVRRKIPCAFRIQFASFACLISPSPTPPSPPHSCPTKSKTSLAFRRLRIRFSLPPSKFQTQTHKGLRNRIVPRCTWHRRLCFTIITPTLDFPNPFVRVATTRLCPQAKVVTPPNIPRFGRAFRIIRDRRILGTRDKVA